MVVFCHAEFFEDTDAQRTANRGCLHALGDFVVRPFLASIRRNLDDRNCASWKDIRCDFGYWNGSVISRQVAFCQAQAEIIKSYVFCFRRLLPYWIFSPVAFAAVQLSFVIEQDFQAFLILIERLLVSILVRKQSVDVIH